MSLSSEQELVIDILRQEEMYGSDIIEKSDGGLGRRMVCAILSAMEAGGLITSREIPGSCDGALPRRLYRVTDDGLQTFFRRHSRLPVAIVVPR